MGRVDAAMRAAEAGRTPATTAATPVIETPATAVFEAPPAPPVDRIRLASVNFKKLAKSLPGKIVVDENMSPTSREQYRRLAASLHQAQIGSGMRVVMISSALPGEGKTLTAANLSLTLSESYDRRVLLVDADLRRPSLHKIFRLASSPGLTENLMVPDGGPLPFHRVSPNLCVLTAGEVDLDPMAGLTSPRMRQILSEARESFDWVIVDTPPVGLLSDASLLADNVDTTLFVVKAEDTPYDLVKRAVEVLGARRVLGVVLNRADATVHRHGYGYHYHSRYRLHSSKDKAQ